MDPVSALSLAASVISVIQFSREAAGICSDLIENGSISQYQATEGAVNNLEKSVRALRDPLQAVSVLPRTPEDELLIDITNKCITAATELQTALSKLKRHPDDGFRSAVKTTFRAIRKRREIEQKRKDLDSYEKSLNTCILSRLDINAAKTSQGYSQVLQKLSDLGIAIEDSLTSKSKALAIQTRSAQLLEDLRFPDIFSRQEQINNAHAKTFEWIFREPTEVASDRIPRWASFTHWLKGKGRDESNIYWVHGKAGSGKSTLVSYIVEDARAEAALRTWCGPESRLLMPSFFFWSSGSVLQKNVLGALRSIAYQLLKDNEDVLESLVNKLCESTHLTPNWGALSERRLLSILDTTLDITTSKDIWVCCFLDGLDEYDGDRDLLRDWIFSLSAREKMKMCVSSRPEESYRRAFLQMPQLRLQDLTEGDITVYIHDRPGQHLPKSSSTPSSGSVLLDDILQRASGVFLWVKLVIRDLLMGLEAGEDIQQLRQRLMEMPAEMQELYSHMLNKVPKSFISHSAHYLSMMMAVYEFEQSDCVGSYVSGLSLLELALCDNQMWPKVCELDADVASEPSLGDLCGRIESHAVFCCAGMVEIEDAKSQTGLGKFVRSLAFIHRSAFEFLEAEKKDWLGPLMAQAFLFLARAKLGSCLLCFSRKLAQPWSAEEEDSSTDERSSTKSDQSSTVENRSSLTVEIQSYTISEAVYDNDDLQLEKPILKEMIKNFYMVKSALLGLALLLENRVASQPTGDDGLQIDCEKFLSTLIALLRKFDQDSWQMQPLITPWRARKLASPREVGYDEEVGYLIFYSFHLAIARIRRFPPTKAFVYDWMLDCVLSSPSVIDNIAGTNRLHIAWDLLKNGANLQRPVIMESVFKPDPVNTFEQRIPCIQKVWSFLIWLTACSEAPINKKDVLGFLSFCLTRGVNPNANCYVPVAAHGYSGYFIQEISVLSVLGSQIPHAKTLETMKAYNAKSHSRFPFYIDEKLLLYELNDTQSDMVGEAYGQCAPLVYWENLAPEQCAGRSASSFMKEVVSYVRQTLDEATMLGSLKSGVVVGDETTYKIDTETESNSQPPAPAL